jgi:hypothetical protein
MVPFPPGSACMKVSSTFSQKFFKHLPPKHERKITELWELNAAKTSGKGASKPMKPLTTGPSYIIAPSIFSNSVNPVEVGR